MTFDYCFFNWMVADSSSFQSRNMAQIAALEAEMAKVQKQLDAAKATYSSLQKQYNEQCRTYFYPLRL